MAAAIEGFVASHVGTALTYICCLRTNINDLTDAAKDLEDAQADLQLRVDVAKRNGEKILNQVETWLVKAEMAQVFKILKINGTQVPGIFNLKSRYTMSKRAKEIAESMNKLRDACNFVRVSSPGLPASMGQLNPRSPLMAEETAEPMYQVPDYNDVRVSSRSLPASMGQLTPPLRPTPGIQSRNQTEEDIITAMGDEETQIPPLRPTRGIESRKNIEEDIIKALRDEKVYVIGICGMAGVGKTTMAKEIMHRAKEHEGLFEEVVMVVVGQQVDLLKIQHAIADWLKLRLEEDTLEPRARRLRTRLQGGKRKLIIIDDVWKRINLEELGIPRQSVSCTILLTSRHMDVLHQMNTQRVFTVQILSEEEAWSMFQENVGACLVDDPNLLPIACEVAKECKGLPLALVVVSMALNGEVDERFWKNALKQLKSSNPMGIENFIAEVYNPIRWSYDVLENPPAKSLWFLCSSFPEDHEINLEYLALYGFGLRILGNINSLEEARNRIAWLVHTLKRRFLILHGKDKNYVKMHDVVRDVAIFISLEENNAILEHTSVDWSNRIPHNDCNMLSSILKQSPFAFPNGLTFPKLSFLLWMNKSGFGHAPLSDDFPKGMKQLKVLSITSCYLILTPQIMQLLKNLRTLHLRDCVLFKWSDVGELSNLEILCCHSCPYITELPEEIGELQCLRLLEVTNCRELKKIVPGVISKLVQLEELKILDGFKGWESEETETGRSNASLFELQFLSKLTCLEIQIEDSCLDAQVLQLFSKIVKYNIQVGEMPHWLPLCTTTHEKKLHIRLRTDASLANWIDAFSRTVEYLCLVGDGYNGLDSSGHQNRKLVTSASTDSIFGVFPMLEELHLYSFHKLEEICDGQITYGFNSFAKLKKLFIAELHRLMHVWKGQNPDVLLSNLCTLHISRCGNLRRVFWSTSVEKRSVSQLETLEIDHCKSMEEVFWIDFEYKYQGSGSSCITFPKLEKLSLRDLGSLTDFWKGMDIIEFPQLVQFEISSCPKLISFNNASDKNHANSLVDDSIHIFCNTKTTFGSLKKLHIGGYKDISYLWCRHIPHLFFRELEELTVYNISNISNLFSYSTAANLVNLKKLTIDGCDEMVYAIAEDDPETSEKKPLMMIFHALKELTLNFLPKLQSFCEGRWNIQLPSLERLDIEHCPAMEKITKSQSTPNSEYYSANVRVHLFCSTQITFYGLKDLCIGGYESGCDHICHLFSYSMAGSFLNLETLSIYKCSEMVYVIADDDDNAQTSETKPQIIFHKLQWVELKYLPKMRSLCDWGWDVRFPSLEILNSLECPGMDGVTPESLRNQNMEAVQSRRLAREILRRS